MTQVAHAVIDDRLADQLKAEADRQHRSVAYITREAIRLYLTVHAEKKAS
jgi:predicted transcriptional regulator